MQRFSTLFSELDQTTKTNAKVEAMVRYFAAAPERDVVWAIALLSHKRPKRTVKTNELKIWAAECARIPVWLFEETYHIVGDLAETIAQVHPNRENKQDHSLSYWIGFIQNLGLYGEQERKEAVLEAWGILGQVERFVFNKIITGGFRVGVSQLLMIKALAKHFNLEESILSHRLMGEWDPATTSLQDLLLEENTGDKLSRPYPFYLAYALEGDPAALGDVTEWIAERKWDGIRGQLIVRGGKIFVWSRGEELVTDKFPELAALLDVLPDGTVLDGEILPFKDGKPLTFNVLQTRIGRKNIAKKNLEEAPVVLLAYDLLEQDGEDLRPLPLEARKERLAELVRKINHPNLLLSEVLPASSWDDLTRERAQSRECYCEGLMLKRRDSPYLVGRKRGDWWKWKVNPLTIDAVMIYAMRGHGRRANLYSDYTFAVWDGDELVAFAKAYSGLTDEEMRKVDLFVKRNTVDRFGPVRSVKPELVFELAFEGINASPRHKSGVALRFPRISRWRIDKPASEANTLADLKAILENYK
jgi:DNA ligase-1